MLDRIMAEDLYEADFHLWSQRQAEAWRTHSRIAAPDVQP